MITFDHSSDTISGTVGTTKENISNYLKQIEDTNPETVGDVVSIIFEDIQKDLPEAVAMLMYGFNDDAIDAMMQHANPYIFTLLLQIYDMVERGSTITHAAELLLKNMKDNEALIKVLIASALMA